MESFLCYNEHYKTRWQTRLTIMSDTDKSKNPNEQHQDPTEPWRKTQIVKRPKLKARAPAPADDEEEVVKQTNILSRDNPLLRRALNQNANAEHNGTTSLNNSREVILLIRGMIERIIMENNKAYTLGRFDTGVTADNEIDLTPYGALDRGVSRNHALLQLADDHLYLTDLQSTNGTYVAGERLEPDTPTIVHKGDEVLVGRLAIQIMFR
jgi:pSer/pThr/pTyr-binding forkhead associated (FHA) protein